MRTLILTALLLAWIASGLAAQQRGREAYPEQVEIEHNQAVVRFSSDYLTSHSSVQLPRRSEEQLIYGGGYLTISGMDHTEAGHGTQTGVTDLSQGLGHFARIVQIGMENYVGLEQYGLRNVSDIYIIGDSNEFTLGQQGSNNTSSIWVEGSWNTIQALQKGSYNYLELDFTGSGLNQQFEQFDNFQHIEYFGIGIPIIITQHGDGARVVVDHR